MHCWRWELAGCSFQHGKTWSLPDGFTRLCFAALCCWLDGQSWSHWKDDPLVLLLPAVLTATLDRDGGHPGPCRQPCDLRRSHWQARQPLLGIFLVSCRDRQPGRLSGIGLVFCHLGHRFPVGGQGQFVQ